jgi:hypothetical protein
MYDPFEQAANQLDPDVVNGCRTRAIVHAKSIDFAISELVANGEKVQRKYKLAYVLKEAVSGVLLR